MEQSVGSVPELVVTAEGRLYLRYRDGSEQPVRMSETEQLLVLLVEREIFAAKLAFTGMGTGAWPGNIPYDKQPWWRWVLWAEWSVGRAEGERSKAHANG